MKVNVVVALNTFEEEIDCKENQDIDEIMLKHILTF